jgi:putative colanic acid biosynthesis UDP-glucose lipid carrier transferase
MNQSGEGGFMAQNNSKSQVKQPLLKLLRRLIDPVIIVVSLRLWAEVFGTVFSGAYISLSIIVFLVYFIISDKWESPLWYRNDIWRETRKVLFSWLLMAGVVLFIGYVTKNSALYSRTLLLTWFVTTPIVLLLAEGLFWVIMDRVLGNGQATRSAVIAGITPLNRQLAQRIPDYPYLGLSFKGSFDDRNPERQLIEPKDKYYGTLSDLPDYVNRHKIDVIFITLPMVQEPRILDLLDRLKDTTASIYFVPDIFIFDLVQSRVEYIGGMPAIAVCETPYYGINAMLKRASDMVLASIALLLLSPLLLFIAFGVKLTSEGPIIFKQRRYGLDGREIAIYKFRSMTVCEDNDTINQATREDARITPLGRLLRRTSMDELPQFYNVLQGTMSVVGPRPHAVAHNEKYRKIIKGYMMRHKVKPGITGWAQVNGLRGETETVNKMENRIKYDLDYLRRWSIFLDLKIIWKTVYVVFRDPDAY